MACRFSLRILLFFVSVGLISVDSQCVVHAAGPLTRMLMPQPRVEADPKADYSLTEEDGPWLILAASFNGPEGEAQARNLILELRSEYNLPAYYYGMTFKLDDNPGRGIDDYGGPVRRRYRRGEEVLQHAVLVGNFASIDDPEAQQLLERIKTMQPQALAVDGEEDTHQSLATFRRQMGVLISQKVGKPLQKGPMGHAFLTRNQLLPREYFVPKGVDPDVAKWNEGVEHSLLDCPGKYSIRVATFRGRTFLKDLDNPEHQGLKRARQDDPLVKAAQNAHKLTTALRLKGWEAYEFHDRHESYVTIGAFDQMHRLPDDRLMPATQEARIIVQTFGAMAPTNVFNRPAVEDIKKEQEVKQRFASHFTNGKVAEGFHPKRFVGVPFDIHPTPIETPQRPGLSAAYARR